MQLYGVMIFDSEFSADADERIPRAEERLCLLQNSAAVANIFIRMARRKAEALEAGEETEGGEEALGAFVQASRILHVSVALQPRVEKELAALRAGDPLVETTPRRSTAADPQNPPKPERDRMARRSQVRGYVLELVDPDSFEEEECERIYEQLTERIYESDRYDAFLDLPLEQAVDAICKDLGVRPQYELWEGLSWPPWRQNPPQPDPPPAEPQSPPPLYEDTG
jgi:hypothetical protein